MQQKVFQHRTYLNELSTTKAWLWGKIITMLDESTEPFWGTSRKSHNVQKYTWQVIAVQNKKWKNKSCCLTALSNKFLQYIVMTWTKNCSKHHDRLLHIHHNISHFPLFLCKIILSLCICNVCNNKQFKKPTSIAFDPDYNAPQLSLGLLVARIIIAIKKYWGTREQREE